MSHDKNIVSMLPFLLTPQVTRRNEYNKILKDEEIPCIFTKTECFVISPDAVLNLTFDKDEISFNASFGPITRDISIRYADIVSIERFEDED
jgi:stringent starvation protein B